MDKFVSIDGININATHFGSMKKDEAVEAMLNEGFVPDGTKADKKAWAAKTYTLLRKEVADEDVVEDQAEMPDYLKNVATNDLEQG